MPKLDKLFMNPLFIRQVSKNKIPYLIGYSSDGNHAAFINYSDINDIGYFIQVYNILSGEITYSIFIPQSDKITESKEYALAVEALEKGFKIDKPPQKKIWEDGMIYETNEGIWYFYEENNNKTFDIKIAKKMVKDKWLIKVDKLEGHEMFYIEFFVMPDNPDFITLIVHSNSIRDEEIINYEYVPVFINLKLLTNGNAESSKKHEADNWLYGNFEFIYDKGTANNQRGFLAVSSEENLDNDNLQSVKIDQWVYIEPTGKMTWYGNSEGIFNNEAKPIPPLERMVYYHINLLYSPNGKNLEYFTINQYDKETDELINILEFKWDNEKKKMVPIQNVKL